MMANISNDRLHHYASNHCASLSSNAKLLSEAVDPVAHACETVEDSQNMTSPVCDIKDARLQSCANSNLLQCVILEFFGNTRIYPYLQENLLTETSACMLHTFMSTWVTVSPYQRDRSAPHIPYDSLLACLSGTVVGATLLPLLISILARSTGGCVNPIITLAACVFGVISFPRMILYIVSQMLGAVTAGLAVRRAYGSGDFVVRGCYLDTNKIAPLKAYTIELTSCIILMYAILKIAIDRRRNMIFNDALSPWLVGCVIECVALIQTFTTKGYMGTSETYTASIRWEN